MDVGINDEMKSPEEGIEGIASLVKQALTDLAHDTILKAGDPVDGWRHFLIDLPDADGPSGPSLQATASEFGYEYFQRSADEASTIIQDRLRDGDAESVELLIRVRNIWVNFAECLQRSNNAHTEKEIGRLFCDHCVFLVNYVVREAQGNPVLASKAAGLEADFKALSDGMHKLLLRKAEAHKELTQMSARLLSRGCAVGRGVGASSAGRAGAAALARSGGQAAFWEQYEEEESEQMELIANKIVNCNRTMRQIAQQLEEVMDEQSALGRSQEVKLADMIFKHSCASLRERLRIRSTMLIEETLRSLADVKASQTSVIDLQEYSEVEYTEKDAGARRAMSELRAAREQMDDERAQLHLEMQALLLKIKDVEERVAQIQLQEDALESILEMNLERIQHARGKGKKQVAVFEKRKNDLEQRVHALELLQDRGAALLESISIILCRRAKEMAARNLEVLLVHHMTDSAIYMHADAMRRIHMNEQQSADTRMHHLLHHISLNQHLSHAATTSPAPPPTPEPPHRSAPRRCGPVQTPAGACATDVAQQQSGASTSSVGASTSSSTRYLHIFGRLEAVRELTHKNSEVGCKEAVCDAQGEEEELMRCERQWRCAGEEVEEAGELLEHFDRRCDTSVQRIIDNCKRLRVLAREGGPLLQRAGAGAGLQLQAEGLLPTPTATPSASPAAAGCGGWEANAAQGYREKEAIKLKPSAPRQLLVKMEGPNVLACAPLHTINGNMGSISEVAARLGVTRMPSRQWQASAGLEFAATDASIIILSRTSSEVEELTQKGVELEASATYVFRIKGIRSEKGQATLGLRVRSERGGYLIADASERRFWGGADGWDDPDILQPGPHCGKGAGEGVGGGVTLCGGLVWRRLKRLVPTRTLWRLSLW